MATVIDYRAYFTTLPRDYYLSAEIFEQERERLLTRQWHYAGHISEVPGRGDYIVIDLLGESIVIARGEEGAVHAFLNVCRHRGHPVCQAPKGSVRRRFVCPYHQWTYDLDGRLRHAPSVDDGSYVDYADWGLHTVKVEVWHGLIFVCLGEPITASASVSLDEAAPELYRLEPERLKQVHAVSYEIEANWKVLMENFQECYHCKGSHPELCVAMDLKEMLRVTVSQRPVSEFYGGGTPTKPGVKSLSSDGEYVSSPLLGEFGRGTAVPEGFDAGFAIQPMLTRGIFSPDHATIHTLRPIDATHVRWISRWLVQEDAREGVDYDLERLTAVWRATNEQDLSLVEGAFRGVQSRRFVPGPLSTSREWALNACLTLYLQLMDGAD